MHYAPNRREFFPGAGRDITKNATTDAFVAFGKLLDPRPAAANLEAAYRKLLLLQSRLIVVEQDDLIRNTEYI
jgi:hypothetical protein